MSPVPPSIAFDPQVALWIREGETGATMPTITREGVSIDVPVEADALAQAIRWHEISNDTETTPEQVVKTAEVFAAFLRG